MQVILKFPSEHTRTLIEDVSADALLAMTPLDVLVARLQSWGVWYGGIKHVPNSAAFKTTNDSINFVITMEVAT